MTSRPNVLWLSLESVRADHTSLYGYRRDTTPTLDELAEVIDQEGIDWTEKSQRKSADFDEETRSRLRDLGHLT